MAKTTRAELTEVTNRSGYLVHPLGLNTMCLLGARDVARLASCLAWEREIGVKDCDDKKVIARYWRGEEI